MCLKEKCRFWHLKGTLRHKEDQRSYDENQIPEVKSYAGIANPSSSSDAFLGQMKAQINQDMIVLRQQQQAFMQQMNQQMQQLLVRVTQEPPRQVVMPQQYIQPQVHHPNQSYVQPTLINPAR